jgi:hypothetical protein
MPKMGRDTRDPITYVDNVLDIKGVSYRCGLFHYWIAIYSLLDTCRAEDCHVSGSA